MFNPKSENKSYSLFKITMYKKQCKDMKKVTRYLHKELEYSYKTIIKAYQQIIELKLDIIDDCDENSELIRKKLNEIREYKMEISRIISESKKAKAIKKAKSEAQMISYNIESKPLSESVSVIYGD